MKSRDDICERIKLVRETLSLSQTSFGDKLSLARPTISLIENKQRNATDRIIKDICREFNVDFIWLTTGEGNMFHDDDSSFNDRIDLIMAGENTNRKNLMKALVNASDEEIDSLYNLINHLLNSN